MALALIGPLRAVVAVGLDELATQTKASVTKVALVLLAAGFLLAAGVSVLTKAIGFPFAALVFGVVFASLALAMHLHQRTLAARRAHRIADATNQAKADLVVASALLRSALPLLPVAAFVAAFTFGRRR